MGLNIQLLTVEGHEHPTWDWVRHAGDIELRAILHSELTISVPCMDEFTVVYRPVNIETLHARLLAEIKHNHPRWDELCRILRDEPEYYLYFSM